ncbi:MAG: YciI family protein [Dongiaceae bacterium]
MQFMIHCLDKPGLAEVRLANRAAHLAYLDKHGASLIAAGPLLGDDGQAMIGSLLLMEFADRAAAERFCADDPYGKAGLFQSVTMTPWRKVLPK